MSDKIKILFVDDQPEILQGLKRVVRSMRKEWDASFVLGGAEALELLAAEDVDVLVTDMRMPVMDGAELLTEVVRLYPHIIRIVLSGQYDIEHFIRSGWPAHQFLAKPCDADALKNTISQTLVMRDMLESSALKKLVARASVLPSLPAVYFEVEQELRCENASMQKVGEIIMRDVALTAKVLQLVNSPIFGNLRRIDSPTQAVVMLGADLVKSLVLYMQSCAGMEMPAGISLERISSHSLTVGMLAKEIAKMEGCDKDVCADAFLAGILQNVGSLVVLCSFAEEYRDVVTRADAEGLPVWQVEKEIFGASHAEIGAYLVGLWGLPSAIAESIAYHIHPSKCPNPNASFALTAVHVANALEKEPGLGAAFIENDFDLDFLAQQGLLEKMPDWQLLHESICADERGAI